jgi:hypothetical protein
MGPAEKEYQLQAKLRQAQSLSQLGKLQDALQAYLFVFDHSSCVPALAGERLNFLLDEIVTMGRKYPPAVVALKTRRDLRERLALESRVGTDELNELRRLNEYLGEPERTMILYDKLRLSDSRSRQSAVDLSKLLCEDLLHARRYDEFIAVEGHCMWHVALVLAIAELGQDFPSPASIRDSVSLKKRAVRTYEELLLLGRADTASKLKKWILRPQPDGVTYTALIGAAVAAKRPRIARALVNEARNQLSASEMQQIDDIAKRIPQ